MFSGWCFPRSSRIARCTVRWRTATRCWPICSPPWCCCMSRARCGITSSRKTTCCGAWRDRSAPASSLAQAARQDPAFVRAVHGHDVEVEPPAGIVAGRECDLTKIAPRVAIMTFGLEHAQTGIVADDRRGGFAFICALDDGDAGRGRAQPADERARYGAKADL